MVVLLIRNGADPLYKDGEGCNCLHLAAQLGHTAIVAYLVAKGCDVNGSDANGMSPLMWACFRSNSGVDPARLLIRVNRLDFIIRVSSNRENRNLKFGEKQEFYSHSPQTILQPPVYFKSKC